MGLVTIFIIAVGLAMDAFAVSIASGTLYKKLNIRHGLRMAVFFGGFQSIMPLIGSLAAMSFVEYIESYDHWVAFGLLGAVGGKMIYESFKIKAANERADASNMLVLLLLSVATSIDALAVGVTLPMVDAPVAITVTIIGVVTFVLSYIGVLIGSKVGHLFENRIEAVGGIILIGIGIKILLGHMVW